MKIILTGDIPDGFAQDFLQLVRVYDATHPGCTFTMAAITDASNAEVERVLDALEPPFPFRHYVSRPPA